VIPLIGIRRTIAERMTANYQNIPHIKFTSRVIMSEFSAARNKLNELARRSDEQKISATAMLVKLVASTLARHPYLNSSLNNDEILLHRDINIGVAVALENGLIVPVVKNADKKGFAEIAAEVNDLSTRARAGKLINADVKGGTFTISNLGPFGIEQFDAIINAPEAAILAVGATQPEAIPDDDGIIRAYPVIRMTLSADHRIVDGAIAARFMADLKIILEAPILIAY
jgi:pyruvate dehydrogenase E2 component (dihydrolipoamide acetyltransferase)